MLSGEKRPICFNYSKRGRKTLAFWKSFTDISHFISVDLLKAFIQNKSNLAIKEKAAKEISHPSSL